MFLGSNVHMMTQTLEEEDGPCLPDGLIIMNTYTKILTMSKHIAIVVENLTTAPITITKGVKITQVMAANAMPKVGVTPEMC